MTSRSTLLLTLALGLFLAGCGTPHSKEMRIQAQDRAKALNGKLAYDQAWQGYETGQFEQALEQIGAAIKLVPDEPDYHVLRGRICLETHKLEEAIRSLEEAIEVDPEHAEAHYFAGVVYQRWSDDRKAYDHYRKAYELDESSVAYVLATAEQLVALDRYEEAKAFVSERLAYFEHNAALRHLLAQIALLQDDPDTAADLYAEAWRFDPEDTVLLTELADAQLAAGRYEECLLSIRELRRVSEGRRPDLISSEARCLAFMGRLDEASDLYMEVTRQLPDDVDAWADLGAVAWEKGDYHRMALAAARLTTLAPERYEGHLLKGINEKHHGNVEEAIELLRDAAGRARDEALPHLVLGRMLESVGDRDGALVAYKAALRIEPNDAETRGLLDKLSREHLATVPGDLETPHRE